MIFKNCHCERNFLCQIGPLSPEPSKKCWWPGMLVNQVIGRHHVATISQGWKPSSDFQNSFSLMGTNASVFHNYEHEHLSLFTLRILKLENANGKDMQQLQIASFGFTSTTKVVSYPYRIQILQYQWCSFYCPFSK